jgi:hypothetical protein
VTFIDAVRNLEGKTIVLSLDFYRSIICSIVAVLVFAKAYDLCVFVASAVVDLIIQCIFPIV